MSVAPELQREQRLPRPGPGRAGPDARADPLARGARRRPRSPASSSPPPCTAGPSPWWTTRPRRCSSAGSTGRREVAARPGRHRRSAGTSAAGTCPTTTATRWSSTGGPRSPRAFYRASRHRADGRAAAPPVRLRPRASSPPTRTSTCTDRGEATRRAAEILAERDRAAARRARCATSSPPSSPSRTRSSAPTSATTVCVQGAPGTGKTAVGLHRAAYLLYAYRDRLARAGRAGRRPEPRLPRLHRRRAAGARRDRGRARRRSRSCVAGGRPVRGVDRAPTTACSRATRGWPRCCSRAVWSHVRDADRGAGRAPRRAPLAGARVRGAARSWTSCARAASATARRAAMLAAAAGARGPGADGGGRRVPRRPGAGRGRARRARCARYVDDGVAGGRPARRCCSAARRRRRPWPRRRRAARRGRAGAAAVADAARGPEVGARWSAADAVLIDEAADLLERTPQPRATSCSTRRRTCRRCSCARSGGAARPARRPCSATSPRAPRRGRPTPGRSRCATSASPTAHVEELDRGFRVPAAVIEYAARLLPSIAPGLGAPVSVRENPGRLDLERVDAGEPARPPVRSSWCTPRRGSRARSA